MGCRYFVHVYMSLVFVSLVPRTCPCTCVHVPYQQVSVYICFYPIELGLAIQGLVLKKVLTPFRRQACISDFQIILVMSAGLAYLNLHYIFGVRAPFRGST